MINPNLCKRVAVTVPQTITPRDSQIKINGIPVVLQYRTITPGQRYLYLKYSIAMDTYYYTDRPSR